MPSCHQTVPDVHSHPGTQANSKSLKIGLGKYLHYPAPIAETLRYFQALFGISGGSIDIDPEPFTASRMAQLLCKTPKESKWMNVPFTSGKSPVANLWQ